MRRRLIQPPPPSAIVIIFVIVVVVVVMIDDIVVRNNIMISYDMYIKPLRTRITTTGYGFLVTPDVPTTRFLL